MTTWGAWEYSGGNGMRVGIDVSWETVTHGEGGATATIEIYTENQFTYSDSQVLTYGGSLDNNDEGRSSKSFTNSQGGAQTLRDTVHYTYTYDSDEYGSSPGSRTFTASLSGAFNGVTPSASVTSNIPARPIAAPDAPSGVTASWLPDESAQITWTRNAWAGQPYASQTLEQRHNGGSWTIVTSNMSWSATSVTDSNNTNGKYEYRIKAVNSAGSSGYGTSNAIWTTPSAPTGATRTPSGADQVITWTNTAAYGEYNTEVWVSQDDGAYTLLATKTAGTTSHTHTAPSAASKWKYKVRHKTTSGTQLYSAYSNETTQTAGTLSPPASPTALSPAGGAVLDPNVSGGTVFTWTHVPTDGSAQTAFQLQHRLAGTGTWTTVSATTATQAYTLNPVTPYGDGSTVEWQVRTKGSHADYGAWSALASFAYTVTVTAPDPVKLPVVMDLFSGDLEASTTAYEIRDFIMRAQTKMPGGGVKLIDSSYNIKWGSRFIPISQGRSQNLLPLGYHQIFCPTSYTVTNKALTSNVATLTIGSHKLRAGESITVSGVDATFNGTFTIKEVGTTTVLYDKVAANVTSVASGGTVGPTIKGHGDAPNTVPTTTGYVPMASSWVALYYEMVPGWGGKVNGVLVPKKNGVASATNKTLTSNVASIHVPKPHYFAVGDQVRIDIGDPVFDGTHTITGLVNGVSTTAIQYAKTNANVASTPTTGTVRPTGIDTFMGNFHQVINHTSSVSLDLDFVVPSHWIKIALRNADGNDSIEWCTGESDTGWQAPTLTNSWVNFGSGYATAAYRKINGMVQLRGLVTDGTTAASMFTLPAGFRPAAQLICVGTASKAFQTSGGASAGTAHTHNADHDEIGVRIDVNTDGTVVPVSDAGSTWISLSSINFIAEA